MANVLIYSTPICGYCKMAKEFFTKNNIPYTEINVQGNPAKAQEMIQKSHQMGVPVIDIDGKVVVGFDKTKIKALLGLS